jgi:hypothetical protein
VQGVRGGGVKDSILSIVIPEPTVSVMPRNASDEASYLKDFSLPLEMTVCTDFDRVLSYFLH